MVLDDICTANIYGSNAYYLLGLPIDVSSRKLRRRQEDLIDGASVLGASGWNKEFDKYLLGAVDAPSVEAAATLFEKLKDPEYAATAMFFWFWPQGEGPDAAIDAILRGERDIAVRAWSRDRNRSGARGIIARHNLAVILHYYAVDGETTLLEDGGTSSGNNNDKSMDYSDVLGCCDNGEDSTAGLLKDDERETFTKIVDQYWKSSFELWEDLSDDDAFWDVFANRVERLDDPRLNGDFIDSFRDRFPICFDNINADFMVKYIKRKDIDSAKRHFAYMTSTMCGIDDVEETMQRAFKPMTDHVRVLIKQCASTKTPKQVLKACRSLLDGSQDLIKIFKVLVPEGNTLTKGLINDIIATVDNKLPLYSRETGDYEPCLAITRELLPLASTPLMRDRIQKSIDDWAGLVRQARERFTCCICGNYQGPSIGKKEVSLYRDVRPDPTMPGRIQWRTRKISDVPVCSLCSWKFTYKDAAKYAPVKKSMSEGWKLGVKPTQTEMDAANIFGHGDLF